MEMERWRILHKEKDYTVIDNGIFRDSDLSLAERGLLCSILALPDGWDFSVKGMTGTFHDGRDSVYATVNRLIEHGYCKRERMTDKKNGRFLGYDYTFFEVKNGLGCASVPFTAFPDTDLPDTDSPYTENPTQIKYLKNKVLKESSTERGKDARARFTPPTQSDVKGYFVEKGLRSDPMEFWLHFENCDWRLSNGRGARMKDWRLAALSWEKRERQFAR